MDLCLGVGLEEDGFEGLHGSCVVLRLVVPKGSASSCILLVVLDV